MKDKRYDGKEKEQKKNPVKKLIKASTVVGGGVAAYKNRVVLQKLYNNARANVAEYSSRVLNKNGVLSRKMSESKVVLRGISAAIGDNPSITRLVMGAIDPKVAKSMKRSARSSVNLDINRKFNSKSSIENGRKTQVGDTYMKTFINGGSKHFKNPLEHKAVVAKQGNLILDELKKNPFVKDMGEDNFINAITNFDHQEGRILSEPEEHIDNFLEKLEKGDYAKQYSFKDEKERETFSSDVVEAIKKHSDLKGVKENHVDEIAEMTSAYTAAAAFGLINDAHKAPNVVSSSLRKKNYRNIMLSDVENLSYERKRELGLIYVKHENNKKIEVDITKELRNTLDDLKNNKFFKELMEKNGDSLFEVDPTNITKQQIRIPKEHKNATGEVILDKQTLSYYDRLSDIRLDENLLINDLTGEIIDNRHVKNAVVDFIDGFHKSVKMPFLNFNPIDLTPWQTMRSGKTKEGFHLLPAGRVQGFVRTLEGDTFDKAAQKRHESGIRGGFRNNNNFYTGGNVFNYTKEGGLQLIDQNLYLAPSQFGPMSRMMENMVNYTDHELVKERNFWQRLFDIGNQENDSRWTTYKKAIQKLKDPNYGPNAIGGIMFNIADAAEKGELTQEVVHDIIYGAYSSLRAGTQKHARSLSQEVLDFYAPEINKAFKHIKVEGEAFNLSNITDDTYMRATMMAFADAFKKDPTGKMKTTHNRRMFKAGESKTIVDSVEDPTVKLLKDYADSFARNEEEFINAMEVTAPTKLPHGFETMVPIAVEDQALISKTDNARRTFQQYILRFLDKKAFDLEEETVRKGIRKRSSIDKAIAGKSSGFRIKNEDIEAIRDLEALTDLMLYDAMGKKSGRESEARTFFKDILNIEHDGIEKVNESAVRLINGQYEFTDLGYEFQEAITRAQPLWGRAPETSTPSLTGMDFMIMRKSGLGDHLRNVFSEVKKQLSLTNQIIRDEGGLTSYSAFQILENLDMSVRNGILPSTKGFFKEMFAGRHRKGDNLEDVTTSTAIMYGLAERLDNQLQNFGLGLSRQNMGSFQSIMTNQYVRRIVLPYMAYQQAMYFDGLTGDRISDAAADAYVTSHTALQSLKEITQINKALRPWKSMFDQVGFDQMEDWHVIKQFNFATMGLFNDFRSGEETQYYYEHGKDAVRKNRYWSIGSPSPWSGGGVDYYEANWYRKLKSDYKFTDTMYGSEDEYWANHWMPTLTHPLAPIRHFITDTNHYEKKHENDRPYAVVGGFSEIQNIPLIGPALDGTVGRILKPRTEHKGLARAHEEYLSAINDYIASQYTAVNDGAHIVVSPSGQVTVNNLYYQGGQKAGVGLGTGQLGGSGGYGGAGGIGSGAPTETNGITYGANAGIVEEGKNEVFDGRIVRTANALGIGEGGSGLSAGVGYGGVGYPSYRAMISASEDAKQNLAELNYQLVMNKKGVESRAIDNLQNLHDPNLLIDLQDAERISNLKGMGMDAFYSAGELAGIYGFATKTLIGFDESWRGTTLAPSNLMTSYNRAFWDMNLGGMGGSLSEIGRRYVPRDMNKLYYSPIRNELPDWLPGIENGIQGDFLHGDAYSKITHGEMRLPGKAYEALYDLHPDGTGTGQWANYGAFDRFRILADVAPNSEQFTAAKHEIALLRQNGGMTAEMEYEYDEIMKQRKERQSEHRWYNKRFTNADIQTKTVTVTQVIDANTFMTKEFANPIKLAGVDITDSEGDAAEWLSQFIKYGEKIKIGISDDPATRYNNDTYQTISAVVYANKNDEMNGRLFTESIKGQSLNAILANKSWNTQVKLDDNGSAVATRALYGNDVIATGKVFETLTHDILPNIPLFGVVADKILQVRSPIESYIREEVYNKSWKPWEHPIDAWVKPMLNTVAANNPIIAAGQGAAVGWLSGKVGPSNKVNKYRGTGKIIGAIVGAGVSTARVFYEEGTRFIPGGDNVWIPGEVQKEREIDEYFDRLRYVKYKGLYEKTKEIAEREEGVDVDRFFEAVDESGRSNSILKRFIAERSRWLKLSKKTGYGDISAIEETLDSLSSKLGEVEEDRQVYQAGKYTALAIQYRKEYESTFYGMDAKSVDHNSLLKSLSPTNREYIPAFLEANNAKDRQKILKYVPNDIKRLLQAKWGLKEDSKESIQSFFSNHYLPGQDWEGWSAAVSLDDIKIKVMQKHGINPTEAGYWGKDQGRAEDNAAKAIPMHSLVSKIDTGRLKDVLKGAGLSNVDVTMTKSYGEGPGGVNISTNMVKDIKGEVLAMLNSGFTI